MKLLNGSELAGFIKQQQTAAVRSLHQTLHVQPRLAIIVCNNDSVINKYVDLKKAYGADIGVEVDVHKIDQTGATELINSLNKDKTVHGIIVQLPLQDPDQTDEIVNIINPQKDVDGLGTDAKFDAATPKAILWLLAGYNIDLKNKTVVIVGEGRLVGAPLKKILQKSGITPIMVDENTKNPAEILQKADVIISAVGQPGLITSQMVAASAVVIDAGTTSEGGQIKGDVAPDVYELQDITITPQKGGVGPLTVTALFDNVINASRSNT